MSGWIVGIEVAAALLGILAIICLIFRGMKRDIIIAIMSIVLAAVVIVLWCMFGIPFGSEVKGYMVSGITITSVLAPFILGCAVGIVITAVVTIRSVNKAYKDGYNEGKADNT